MKPFLFARGSKNYARFYVPAACRGMTAGKQYLVFSLGEAPPHEIRLRACMLEVKLWQTFQGASMDIDWDKIKKYEIDLGRGVFKAEGLDDHQAMMELLRSIQPTIRAIPAATATTPQPVQEKPQNSGLLLDGLLSKFYLLKKVAPATRKSYDLTVQDFIKFYKGKSYVSGIVVADMTRFREYLGEKGNTARTIDKKLSTLKTLFNFAIEQGYYTGKNPAQIKSLLTKKQKATGGFLIFEEDEIKALFDCDWFREQKEKDPDYYWACLLVLVTGARHEEITLLKKGQLKVSDKGTNFIQIRESKTKAGIREVPIPAKIVEMGLADFVKSKEPHEQIFRYKEGNALGKKFARHIKDVAKIDRGRLVLHSLRKFLNDLMMKNGVSLEARCQFIGHEIENVNVVTYANKFNVDELAEKTAGVLGRVSKYI